MCLLDEVIAWDTDRISCRSTTHRDADHPLIAHGRLGIACGVEYAAQAMAVHGALLAGAAAASEQPPHGNPAVTSAGGGPASVTPAAGFLASVRNVQANVLRLDDVAGDLICEAARVAGDQATALYEFEVRSDARCLLRGRATVILDATGRLHP
jgi:predicted hotdog family 3-hydroxylacyl-ACP dehydratase